MASSGDNVLRVKDRMELCVNVGVSGFTYLVMFNVILYLIVRKLLY